MALAYLLISLSLPSNGSTCHIANRSHAAQSGRFLYMRRTRLTITECELRTANCERSLILGGRLAELCSFLRPHRPQLIGMASSGKLNIYFALFKASKNATDHDHDGRQGSIHATCSSVQLWVGRQVLQESLLANRFMLVSCLTCFSTL
jgi:hypothetical protein